MKRFLKVSFMLAALAVTLSSCNCYNKMLKRVDQVQASANPAVLSLKGNTVSTDVTVVFPARYFEPKATLKITPVMVFEGGEIVGTPKFVQGTRVKDNYTVIDKRAGGSYTQTVTFPYDPRMKISTLELRVEAKCTKGRNTEFSPIAAIAVAQGVSTVQLLADNTAYMTLMPDNFKRVTSLSKDAEIMYVINRSEVRPSELTKEQVKMFEEFVREYYKMDRANLENIAAKGYASPDGPVAFNDKLSKDRSESGEKAISNQLKKEGVTTVKYDVSYYGEDWDGFQRLVSQSNIKDKDLILQVLQMYSNPVKRDEEIKNMTSVFQILAEQILPQLRRTVLVANVDVEGRTDSEITSALASNIDVLSVEELLYGAKLTSDPALKMKAYERAASRFNDARGYNNMGVMLAQEGKLREAKSALDKAASMSNDAAIANNLGAVALANGNVAEARRYLSSLNTPDARANMGLVNLAEGNYAEAARSLDGYNLAVAEVLNGNLSRAKSTLANINTADANYLKAIIAMREGDSRGAIANLRSAISMKPALRAQAAKDIEFAKLFGSSEFLAL